MSIQEHLVPEINRGPKERDRRREWNRQTNARIGQQEFDHATCCTKLRLFRGDFRREVEKELTGKDSEPWELIYFKLYKAKSR